MTINIADDLPMTSIRNSAVVLAGFACVVLIG